MIKNRKNAKSILYLLLIFFIVVCISIGYCVTDNVMLEISGTASAEIPPILYIDSIEIDSSTSSECSYSSYKSDGTLLQIFSLALPKENVTADTNATVLVHLTNLSEFAYTFAGIKYLSAGDLIDFPSISIINSNSNIRIDESSYENLIDNIIESVDGKNKNTMVVPIKFKYVDISNITNNTIDISIKLNFNKLEKQVYNLKTGRDLYNVIGSHYNDATKIIFCTNNDLPENTIKLGNAGLEDEQITAYWKDGTVYISAITKNSTINFHEDSGYMFSNGNLNTAFSKVTSIEKTKNVFIDTSNVKNFSEIFKGCTSLTDSGIQGFLDILDTSNATNMCAMFGSTLSLTTIDLRGFNTSNVIDMSWMFENNTNLTNIIFGSNFVTSAVQGTKDNEGLAGMFSGCSNIKTLNLSNFDTSNVRTMFLMFSNCENLEKIYVSDKFVTTGLSDKLYSSGQSLFENCFKLKGEQGTAFSLGNDGALYARIDGGEDNPGYFSRESEYIVNLYSNDGTFSNGETVKTYTGANKINITLDEKPVKEESIFIGWTEIKDSKKIVYRYGEKITFTRNADLYAIWLDKGNYMLKKGTEVYNIISNYRATTEHIIFTYLDKVPENSTLLGNVDEHNLGNIKAYYNETTKTIYFATIISNSVVRFNEDSSNMFSYGDTQAEAFEKLQTIKLDNKTKIDTQYVEDFSLMFKYNVSLTQEGCQEFINNFDTSSAINMCAMFEYLTFSTIDISHFNTRNVTDMSWLFHGSKYSNIILGDNFDTTNVMNFKGMFQELSQIVTLDISTFKVKKGALIDYMFGLCPKLQRIYVSKDNGFENAKTGSLIFQQCTSLIGGIGENETTFASAGDNSEYVRISTTDAPGYFTDVSDKN